MLCHAVLSFDATNICSWVLGCWALLLELQQVMHHCVGGLRGRMLAAGFGDMREPHSSRLGGQGSPGQFCMY